MKRDKENWIVETLETGYYIVMVRTPWVSTVNQFNFSIYGEEKSQISQISDGQRPKNFLQNILLSHSKTQKLEW